MAWCPNPLKDFLNFINLVYILLLSYIILGFVFAFMLAIKCYAYEPKLFKIPMIIVCTSLGHIFLYYYYYSLKENKNFNLCDNA
jgi:hypothetical protein